MNKSNILREYIANNPDMPNKTLARKVLEEYPDLYGSVESARGEIRRIIGQRGIGRKPKDETYLKEPGEASIKSNVGNPYTNTTEMRKSPAKILIFDIETAPIRAFVWGLWKQNVGTNQIISDWFCLSWSAKWLFEDHVMSDVLKPKEVVKENDKRIIKSIWALLNEADIVIAHNGDKFDLRKLRTRFIFHGLKPPSPFLTIDTLKHARTQFNISSNRLDYLGEFLNLGRKSETGGFELWDQCMSGSVDALNKMNLYCNQDVLLLESVYLEMRPWIKPHPNVGLFVEDDVDACPSCGSSNLKVNGSYYTTVNRYDALQCDDCGAWSRSRVTSTPLKDNKGVKSSIPK